MEEVEREMMLMALSVEVLRVHRVEALLHLVGEVEVDAMAQIVEIPGEGYKVLDVGPVDAPQATKWYHMAPDVSEPFRAHTGQVQEVVAARAEGGD